MSTTRTIAHNTIVQLIGKAISTLLGLIALGIMGRYLGQEQFGWYITTISFLQFVGIVMDFGLIPVTAQMLSEPAWEKQRLLQNLLGYRFITAILFLAIAPAAALFFPYPRDVKIAIGFSTISFLAVAMNQIFIGYYQTKLQMHVQAIGEVIGRIVLIVCLWAFIAAHASYLWVMATLVFSSVAYTMVLWAIARSQTKISFAYDKEIWLSITKKMWPIAISIIFNVVYLKGDVILLSLFREQTEVGLYGAAYRVLDILGQTAMMIMGVMLPLLTFAWSRDKKEEFKYRLQQAFDIMMLFSLPITVGIMILATPIMSLVFGPEFGIAGPVLAVLALAVFAVFVGAIFGHAAVAIDRQKNTIWIYASTAVFTLIGYLLFIPKYGMTGAAWMTAFSEIYAGLMLLYVIRHFSGVTPSFKLFFKCIYATIAMSVTILLVPQWHVLILIGIGAVIYAGALYALGGISKKTIKEIASIKSAPPSS